jgi:hypothetical protein
LPATLNTRRSRARQYRKYVAIITSRLTLELVQILLSLRGVARITGQLVALRPAILVKLVHANAKFVEGTHRISDGDVQPSGVLGVLRACCGQQDEILREEVCEGERSLG